MFPRLYAILDTDALAGRAWAPIDVVDVWLDAGVRLIQLRAKSMSSGAFQALADDVVARAHAAGARVIINDRADIARLSGADGVHVGQDDLTPAQVRQVVGHRAIVGLSTHDEVQALAAQGLPISYLAIGPVFETGTKNTGYAPRGLGRVERASAIAHAAGLPLVAIGGITLANAPQALAAGADTVAVISGLLGDSVADLGPRVRAWTELLR